MIVRLGSVLLLSLALVSCGNDTPTTPTSPSTPTTVTETFSGTVNQNGAVTHTFSTTTSGTVTATLTTLSPDSTQIIGLSLGTWNGATCAVVLANDQATQGSVVTGGVSALGSLCVRAYDVGHITPATPFSYEITVVHP